MLLGKYFVFKVLAALALVALVATQDILIADQFNNRILQVTHDNEKRIVWHFGSGSPDASTLRSCVAPNDAIRLKNEKTLISCTGAPAGTEPAPCDTNDCPDSRVFLVPKNLGGGNLKIPHYGTAGVPGAARGQLSSPVFATNIPNSRDILITDQGNQRILRGHDCTFSVVYGKTGVSGSGMNELNDPNSAILLQNYNLLIADEGNNRVIEVNLATKEIVWSYGSPTGGSPLNAPAFASRLPNGNTLITDSNNNRILEVSKSKEVVWQYYTNTRAGSVAQPNPTRAVRLKNGNTLISDQFNHQVIEVNSDGDIVWSFGEIGVAGNDSTHLNAPYDAKVIGDFTGLAPQRHSNSHLSNKSC
jgi:hypothetical protein